MKKRRLPTTQKGQQQIRTRVKRHQGTPHFLIYNVTVRGELPIDLSARVSAVHARSILESDSGVSSDLVRRSDTNVEAVINLGAE